MEEKRTCCGYYHIPEFIWRQVFCDMNSLTGMVSEMIRLHQEEERLKRHHRAYLHVRDYQNAVCSENERRMSEIVARWQEQKCTCEQMGCMEEKEDADATQKETKKMDGEEGMVLMSSASLGVMHDDMICLMEALDTTVALFRAVLSGVPVSKPDVLTVLSLTSSMSEEIFKRWEEAQMLKLA